MSKIFFYNIDGNNNDLTLSLNRLGYDTKLLSLEEMIQSNELPDLYILTIYVNYFSYRNIYKRIIDRNIPVLILKDPLIKCKEIEHYEMFNTLVISMYKPHFVTSDFTHNINRVLGLKRMIDKC